MNAGKTYPYQAIVVIVCLILATYFTLMMHSDARRETNQQGQPAVEKLYGVHYYPNRMVIKLRLANEKELTEAMFDISKKYEIEELIPLLPCEFRVIAMPKDPNSPLP